MPFYIGTRRSPIHRVPEAYVQLARPRRCRCKGLGRMSEVRSGKRGFTNRTRQDFNERQVENRLLNCIRSQLQSNPAIRRDALEKLHALGASGLPSNVVLITGPSKTGDMELELTTGVHGPGRWIVIVVRGS